jgi:ligand-binding SRPBCC domain-containing protein
MRSQLGRWRLEFSAYRRSPLAASHVSRSHGTVKQRVMKGDPVMPVIELSTLIRAPRERVFDLARSIDAHQHTTGGTEERAVAGVTSGLIGMGDEVTWQARHFGVRQRLTVRVTAFDRPKRFQDIMIAGAFRRMGHDHEFEEHPAGTRMRDRFEFQSPLGFLGRLVDSLFLTAYMRRFLAGRNTSLKQLAESDEWRRYLDHAKRADAQAPVPLPNGEFDVVTDLVSGRKKGTR